MPCSYHDIHVYSSLYHAHFLPRVYTSFSITCLMIYSLFYTHALLTHFTLTCIYLSYYTHLTHIFICSISLVDVHTNSHLYITTCSLTRFPQQLQLSMLCLTSTYFHITHLHKLPCYSLLYVSTCFPHFAHTFIPHTYILYALYMYFLALLCLSHTTHVVPCSTSCLVVVLLLLRIHKTIHKITTTNITFNNNFFIL